MRSALRFRWVLAASASAVALVACASAGDSPAAAPHQAPPACVAPGAWYRPDAGRGVPLDAAALFADLARRDVVLLGEQHDDADHHLWQVQAAARLHALRPNVVLGFEAFPRRVQAVLDRWIEGKLSEKQFLEQADWDKVWGLPAELYLPLFRFARINRIPMVALNVERELTQEITRVGWNAVPAERKEGVSRPAPPSPEYRESLFDVYKKHPRAANRKPGELTQDDPDFRNFIDSQTTWDRAMAEAIATKIRTSPPDARPMVIGIMGGGHVRHGYGVAHQLRDLGVASVGAMLPVDAAWDCAQLAPGLADAVFAFPPATLGAPPKPRLGVQLSVQDGAVTILKVMPGSLAEQTGLKDGDRIATIAGNGADKMSVVIAAIRAQPAGTWLPIQVRRANTVIDLLIKFPPAR